MYLKLGQVSLAQFTKVSQKLYRLLQVALLAGDFMPWGFRQTNKREKGF